MLEAAFGLVGLLVRKLLPSRHVIVSRTLVRLEIRVDANESIFNN